MLEQHGKENNFFDNCENPKDLLLPFARRISFLMAVPDVLLVALLAVTGSLSGGAMLFTGWKARRRRTRRYVDILSVAVRHELGSCLRGFEAKQQ